MDLTVLGAALAIGLSGLGVTIGEALIGKESLDVLSKNPDLSKSLKSMTILGIALAESAAIYGLVVALLILFVDVSAGQAIAAGLSIGLVGFAAGLCEWWIVKQALQSYLRNPAIEGEIKSNMILYVAMVESAAIYALVVALLILFIGG